MSSPSVFLVFIDRYLLEYGAKFKGFWRFVGGVEEAYELAVQIGYKGKYTSFRTSTGTHVFLDILKREYFLERIKKGLEHAKFHNLAIENEKAS